MQVRNNVNSPNFGRVFIGYYGKKLLQKLPEDTLIKLQEANKEMVNYKYYDLGITDDGPVIRPKGSDWEYRHDFIVSRFYPTVLEFSTYIGKNNTHCSDAKTISLNYLNKEEADKAYNEFKKLNETERAIKLTEELEHAEEKTVENAINYALELRRLKNKY